MTTPRTWLITGAGRGLGRAFAAAALGRGDHVAATARRPEQLDDLAAAHGDALHVLRLDVRDRAAVRRVVDDAHTALGHLDVVVNNAGYGIVGMTEELSEDDAREHLDTNLLGALWVTQAAVPHLRRRRGGHVVQISSVGGVGAMAGFGLYNAGKWGLEGFSEALARELAPFGVRVTIAELSGFATDWGATSMRFATPDPAYDGLREQLYGTAEIPWPPAGADPNDAPPTDAARALLEHVDAPDGPLRLLVGDDAPGLVAMALDARRLDYGRDPRFRWPADA